MNKLDQMDIASLNEQEIERLREYEEKLNKLHEGEEVYLLALKR